MHMLMMTKKLFSGESQVGSALGTDTMCQNNYVNSGDDKQTNHCRNICNYAYCVLGMIELKVFRPVYAFTTNSRNWNSSIVSKLIKSRRFVVIVCPGD